MPDHPAKFSKGMPEFFGSIIHRRHARLRSIDVLDPFAGTGRIHDLHIPGVLRTTGVEIEGEWAAMHQRTIQGDSRLLTDLVGYCNFDVICTSPTYGNRMADKHNAKDKSKRRTYKHTLGRDLDPHNSGGMQWGDTYKGFHVHVWEQCYWAHRPGGTFILNVSDHIRKGEIVNVTGWHTEVLEAIGYTLEEAYLFPTRGMRFGANHQLRTPGEYVLVYRRNMA